MKGRAWFRGEVNTILDTELNYVVNAYAKRNAQKSKINVVFGKGNTVKSVVEILAHSFLQSSLLKFNSPELASVQIWSRKQARHHITHIHTHTHRHTRAHTTLFNCFFTHNYGYLMSFISCVRWVYDCKWNIRSGDKNNRNHYCLSRIYSAEQSYLSAYLGSFIIVCINSKCLLYPAGQTSKWVASC